MPLEALFQDICGLTNYNNYTMNVAHDCVIGVAQNSMSKYSGDAYSFQGDERDVIFLSLVAAKGPTRITALADEKARQRCNVAVSRAKDQLWLMHSITFNELSNRDDIGRFELPHD